MPYATPTSVPIINTNLNEEYDIFLVIILFVKIKNIHSATDVSTEVKTSYYCY